MNPNKLHLMVNLKNKLMEQQCFSSLKNLKTLYLNFYKTLYMFYKNRDAKDCKFVEQF